MAANSFRPPKQWALTENETITDYAKWQSNILYHLSLCNEFAPYLDATWGTASVANHGLADDPAPAADQPANPDRKTAVQKSLILDRMLALIAQFAPSLLNKEIIKRSTSLAWIWTRIRKHYNFNQSEVNFLNIHAIKRKPEERYETFFQRIMAHLEDNLLTVASGLQHDGVAPDADENMSPTTERLAVYLWLQLIDDRLPAYVARVYAHELQMKTLKDIQPMLSQSMDSLLAEISCQEEVRVHYAKSGFSQKSSRSKFQQAKRKSNVKGCSICKAAGRPSDNHDITACWFLSKMEKMEIGKALQVIVEDNDDFDEEDTAEENEVSNCSVITSTEIADSSVMKVECDVSPSFYAFYQHHPCKVVLDTGATSSVVSLSFVRSMGIQIQKTQQSARSADKSSLLIQGEVHFNLYFGQRQLPISALVLEKLDCDILAGIPFCKSNDVHIHLKSETISIGDKTIPYGGKIKSNGQSRVCRVKSFIVRNNAAQIVMPGAYFELQHDDLRQYDEVAIEPPTDAPFKGKWPPSIVSRVIDGYIRIPNLGDELVKINRSQHVAQVRSVYVPSTTTCDQNSVDTTLSSICSTRTYSSSDNVIVDPDGQLSVRQRKMFCELLDRYSSVFSRKFGTYNDKSGRIRAHVNIGPVEPPSRKGKLPCYNRSNLQELQKEADILEELGVLAKPEDLGVQVKFVSPSFLVRKPDGSSRFVTAFNNLSPYVRLLPTATISCNEVLRKLSSFKFLIKTDLTKSFFQIPLDKSSIPYVATATPFKGLRVYTRAAMGMPGSSEILQELTSRVFGDLLAEGILLILADDLFIGGNTIEEMLYRWEVVLQRLSENNLTLSPTKTIVCPKSTTILGWIWSSGTLAPSKHKVSALSSVPPPKTCTAMRSYIGAFKAVSRCIPNYASLLSGLEDSIKGLQGSECVNWSDDLLSIFTQSQSALKSPAILTIPIPSDQMSMTVDASPLNKGLGATLYVNRDGKRCIAEFYSFKLKDHQLNWYPCELEALAIAAGVEHFSPYICNSINPMQILSDSKPCVQAYQRLCQGQFSASARISTFLSTLSAYRVSLHHIAGKDNISSDFSSRNPQECSDNACQICKFVDETVKSVVVNTITVKDVLEGKVKMPFMNRNAWKSSQHDCGDLRRAFAHLKHGTSPSRKARNMKNLRRYLNIATLDNDGLIIVNKDIPFQQSRSLIVVPVGILHGVVTALHILFKHPTKHQMKLLFERYFYAIKSDQVIEQVCDKCDQCNSLKAVPKEVFAYSLTPSPTSPGNMFFADIMRRTRQKISVVRDVHSSFTCASIITDESADSLRAALLADTALLRNESCIVRIDTASGFQALRNDLILEQYGIKLDFGYTKNKNSNSVVDKAIQELEMELLKIDGSNGPVSECQLQLALRLMNSRIRNRGLSAREILFQRDQVTCEQLQIDDAGLAVSQSKIRESNHQSSARCKAPGGKFASPSASVVGDLVYLKDERDKNKRRDRYIIVSIDGNNALVQKLTDRFWARKYTVPMTKLYPAVKDAIDIPPRSPTTDDSESDYDVNDNDDDPDPDDDNNDSYGDQEPDDDNDNDDDREPEDDDNIPVPDQRPTRNRQQPEWMRSGEYDIT